MTEDAVGLGGLRGKSALVTGGGTGLGQNPEYVARGLTTEYDTTPSRAPAAQRTRP